MKANLLSVTQREIDFARRLAGSESRSVMVVSNSAEVARCKRGLPRLLSRHNATNDIEIEDIKP